MMKIQDSSLYIYLYETHVCVYVCLNDNMYNYVNILISLSNMFVSMMIYMFYQTSQST